MNWLVENRQSVKKEWDATTDYFALQRKIWCNQRAQKAGQAEPYSISPFDRVRQSKPKWLGLKRLGTNKFANLPATVQAGLIAFVSLLLFLLLWGAPFKSGSTTTTDWAGITTELWGLLAEIFVLAVIVAFVSARQSNRQSIARQYELISDFKYWDSEEARFRILGAVRRLQEKGVTVVNLSGIKLSSANLKEHGVTKLDGSTLSGGHWASSIGIRTASRFEKLDFSDCSLQNVRFSMGDGLGFMGSVEFQKPQATYLDCSFLQCDLTGASFEQAELRYSKAPLEETHDHIAVDEQTGQPIYQQTHYGEFYLADLSDVSFKNAWLENVDFRDAEHIETVEFYGARGLESCEFQNDELKQRIIAKSNEQPDA